MHSKVTAGTRVITVRPNSTPPMPAHVFGWRVDVALMLSDAEATITGSTIATRVGVPTWRRPRSRSPARAAHQMMIMAARTKDSGQRNDLEAGMAKYLASEYCKEVVEDSFRIHGGYSCSKEYEIERLYREAPTLLIGEGTADTQRMIIGRRLYEENATGT